jgi:uncharacterized protein (TIGR02466 family)
MENTLILFPIKIKFYKNFLEKQEIKNILIKIKKYKHINHGALKGEASSTHKLLTNFLKDSEVENKLNIVIKQYSKILGIEDQIIFHSWTNIQKKHSKLNKHSHANSPISGVLYLNVDKESSKIYFYNPNPYISVMNIKDSNESNYEYIYFQPEIGDLILFPGWLLHGSNDEINKSKERIALSFNTIDEIN